MPMQHGLIAMRFYATGTFGQVIITLFCGSAVFATYQV